VCWASDRLNGRPHFSSTVNVLPICLGHVGIPRLMSPTGACATVKTETVAGQNAYSLIGL